MQPRRNLSKGLIRTGYLALVLTTTACHQAVPHSVSLKWQPPAPKKGVVVVGYNVYRRRIDSPHFARLAERVPATVYEDNVVNSGNTYLYAVTSVDQRGRESRFSVATEATIP